MPASATNYHPSEDQNSIPPRDLFVTQGKEGAPTTETTEMEDKNQQTLCCNSIRSTADRSSTCDELGSEARRNDDALDGRIDRPSNEAQEEEALERRIERLSRERPKQFKSLWAEVAFIFSIAMSQVLSEYFVSGFTVVLPIVITDLGIPPASSIWPASAFSLVIAAFLLIFGRLGDMYGGYPFYVGGMAWLGLWSLICGFSQNELMLDFSRALQGLGPAAFLPSGMMLIGSIYRPGPRKNLVFSIYGAAAPVGFYIGIFFAGVTATYTTWGWYFWVGMFLSFITAITSYLYIPSDIKERRALGIKMDWLGAILIIVGLILFTFAIIDSAHAPQGWRTPYIYTLFVIGSLLLLSAIYVEAYVADEPLLPASLFKVRCMTPLVFALFFTYGSLGIFLLYATFYMENVMSVSPLLVVAWYTPMAIGGILISTFGGFILHLLSSTILIYIAGLSWIVAPLLFAIAPSGANYWAYIFPSMIFATIGIDVTFTVANIFITTSLPKKEQGLAGALIMLLMHLGIAVCLGLADIVNISTLSNLGQRKSYQAVFWFEVACATTALVILVLFVRVQNAVSALTVDEMAEMKGEARREAEHSAGRIRQAC
ncbi:hypothetical protein V496_09942 [Pseudogymnoascus sp. VKM F-4515 (FW-2607)]|nr:hypothetical protein V496_09942 [Pseudogymnoascus sp. VKM F-4515 (FW-2607)]